LAPEPQQDTALQRRVLLSTASNYAGLVFNLGTWFFLTPFLLTHLGRTQYGLWALVGSLVAYGSLLDLGVGEAVVKYVSEFRAKGDDETASQLISTALVLYLVLGLIVVVLGVALAPIVPRIINVPPAEQSTASWLVIITAVGVAVELPATTAFSVLRGLHRFDLMNVIGSLAIVTLALGTVVVVLLGGNVLAVTAIAIPLTLVWQIPAIWMIHRAAPGLRFGFRDARRPLVRRVATFGSALFGIQVAETLKTKTDEFVIGAALPVSAVAPYSVARRLSTLPTLLAFGFVRVLMPLASQLHAEGRHPLLQGVYVSGMRLTIGIFTAVAGGLMVFAAPFLSAWIGPAFAGDADIVVILTLAGLCQALLLHASQVLQGMDRHRALVVFAIGSGILNLALSIVLVGPLGVKGVALATLVITALELLCVVPFTTSIVDVHVGRVLREALLPSLLPAIPMAAVLFGLRETLAPDRLITIGLCGLAGALVYGAFYLAFPTAAPERTMLRTAVGTGRALVRRDRTA
jgi:O-antigen/teichoic acid export membrane protein